MTQDNQPCAHLRDHAPAVALTDVTDDGALWTFTCPVCSAMWTAINSKTTAAIATMAARRVLGTVMAYPRIEVALGYISLSDVERMAIALFDPDKDVMVIFGDWCDQVAPMSSEDRRMALNLFLQGWSIAKENWQAVKGEPRLAKRLPPDLRLGVINE